MLSYCSGKHGDGLWECPHCLSLNSISKGQDSLPGTVFIEEVESSVAGIVAGLENSNLTLSHLSGTSKVTPSSFFARTSTHHVAPEVNNLANGTLNCIVIRGNPSPISQTSGYLLSVALQFYAPSRDLQLHARNILYIVIIVQGETNPTETGDAHY